METTQNSGRRNFLKQTGAGVIAIAAASSMLNPLNAAASSISAFGGNSVKATITEADFRKGVMPRAQLSRAASQLAVTKATQKNAAEFAGFELEEAIAVIKVLEDVGTPVPAMGADGKAFLEKLKAASGNEFDRLYMEAELTNHEFLRDLAKSYLANAAGRTSPAEKGTYHLATLALFAFDEHVALCKRIYREVSA